MTLSLTKPFKLEPALKGGFSVFFGSSSSVGESLTNSSSPKPTQKTAPLRWMCLGIYGNRCRARRLDAPSKLKHQKNAKRLRKTQIVAVLFYLTFNTVTARRDVAPYARHKNYTK